MHEQRTRQSANDWKRIYTEIQQVRGIQWGSEACQFIRRHHTRNAMWKIWTWQPSQICIYIMSQLVTYKYEISINFHPSRFCFFSCRRRKGERIFLVAFYECNEDFELENLEQDRLYCSHEQWIGNVPKCTALEEESGAEDDEEEEEDEGKNRNCIQSICNEWLWNHQLPSFRVAHLAAILLQWLQSVKRQ